MSRKLLIPGIALAMLGFAATSGIAAAKIASSPTSASTIDTATSKKNGTVLAAEGFTVYTLKPNKKKCDAKCLKAWPPVVLPEGTTAPSAGNGVDQSKLGTTPMADGSMQVTYGGKALYWFHKDKKPGDVKGNVTDKWGKWKTVTLKKGSGSTDTTNPGTGGSSF